MQPPAEGTQLERVWPLITIADTPGPLVGMQLHPDPAKNAWWMVSHSLLGKNSL
jgi:hypothetical protein